jgi:hypothetical protein
VPFGKYWRSRPLVFSLLARCLNRACSAISLPRSQVNVRRSCPRRPVIGLGEDRADRRRHNVVLALGDVREAVPHEVHPAALPRRAQDLRDRLLEPSWASEMTNRTPVSPRRTRSRRNSVQKGAASDRPTPSPRTSRRPSRSTPVAIITALVTMRPASRTLM